MFLEAEQYQNNYRLDVPSRELPHIEGFSCLAGMYPEPELHHDIKKKGGKGKFLAHVLGINLGAKRKPNAGKTHGHANWDKFLSRRWMQMNAQASPAA